MSSIEEMVAASISELNLAPTADATGVGGADEPEQDESDTDTDEIDQADEADTDQDETPAADEDAEDADETEAGEVIDLDPEAWVLIDGQKVQVKDALALKAMATKKTQEAARVREEADQVKAQADELTAQAEQTQAQAQQYYQQVEAWVEEVTSNPADFVAEIVAAGKADPLAVAVSAIEKADDPTLAFSQLLVNLLEGVGLDAEFVAAFGLNDPQHPARQAVRSDRATAAQRKRLAEVERKLAEQAAPKAEPVVTAEQQRAALVSELQGIAEAEGIAEADFDAFAIELIEFAKTQPAAYQDDLARAYDRLQLKKLRSAPAAKPAAVPAAVKSAKPRVITARSSSAGGTRSAAPAGTAGLEDAAAAAYAELFKNG